VGKCEKGDPMANTKDHAHELIDRLAPGQVPVAIRFLEIILDPAALSLATASIESEPISDEENLAVADSKSWLKSNPPISNRDVLAELGLTLEDFERMARTSLDPHESGK
jgi:hypothetical protein